MSKTTLSKDILDLPIMASTKDLIATYSVQTLLQSYHSHLIYPKDKITCRANLIAKKISSIFPQVTGVTVASLSKTQAGTEAEGTGDG